MTTAANSITLERGAAPQTSPKIAHKTEERKNRPHDKAKNRPQDDSKNRPDIINPVSLSGIVPVGELKSLLMCKSQEAWCTSVRLLGLVLLIDYILRNLKRPDFNFSRPRTPVCLKAPKQWVRENDYRTAFTPL